MIKMHLVQRAASWFGHCNYQVCKGNAFLGAIIKSEKDYVRVLLLKLGKMVITDVSDCKYYDLLIMTNLMWILVCMCNIKLIRQYTEYTNNKGKMVRFSK